VLFNSYIFIFVFLPATAFLFHLLRYKRFFRSSFVVLVAASLFFYAWWSPEYLVLLMSLILFNFGIAQAMFFAKKNNGRYLKVLLIAGIASNLAILSYYKYANFFVDNLNYFSGFNLTMATVILPIGISFFTFQKIGLLVDIYQNKIVELDFLYYSLFVTFFPQLIAGPITHHSEVIPQFKGLKNVSFDPICRGINYFVIGLSKKAVLADSIAKFATLQFNACAQGQHLDFLAVWSAALAYTVQLYFDFSGYSDMAIGLGLLFGIELPINFNSPYKSKSVIEFWQRWHITLSRFLKDYLYIPLGGNRKGNSRRYFNLLITMFLGGFWHGAGWTFIAWGALHGLYLVINHGWRSLINHFNIRFKEDDFIPNLSARILTFLAIVMAWVFFRARDLNTAGDMIKSMLGLNGFSLPSHSTSPCDPAITLAADLILLLITWTAPNTQELMHYTGPQYANTRQAVQGSENQKVWRPSLAWGLYIGSLFALSLMMLSRVSEFIYFQF